MWLFTCVFFDKTFSMVVQMYTLGCFQCTFCHIAFGHVAVYLRFCTSNIFGTWQNVHFPEPQYTGRFFVRLAIRDLHRSKFRTVLLPRFAQVDFSYDSITSVSVVESPSFPAVVGQGTSESEYGEGLKVVPRCGWARARV